jgi:hypothetical protein
MAKTLPPGIIKIGRASFNTNAVPDPFDERDFEYRPKLAPLPATIERPEEVRHVLNQRGKACTGYALATTINAVLARVARKNDTQPDRVSAEMLYHFALRYDEYAGEADNGSSLRGALKGWFYHGVCTEDQWDTHNPPDVTASKFLRGCRERPLGAYYRVNCFRLDDMQSAISELHAVVAGAQIHDGWESPQRSTKDGEPVYIIHRSSRPRGIGGHAFAIVGYNRIGFVVQNSWGRTWGDNGFAVLTYEDWLDSAHDAWVVRPGVPHTPFLTGRRRDEKATNAALATGVGPDRRRLDRHVVMLADDGRLRGTGEFVSTPEQLDRVVSRMEEWHDEWSKQRFAKAASGSNSRVKRHIVLFPQGGLNSYDAGLETAQRHLNWWMNNRIYPIYLAWQAGPAESLLQELGEQVERKMPGGGIGFDLVEQFDRLVEMTARRHYRWMWDELKQNARVAAAADRGAKAGALQLADRLRKYVGKHPGDCAVHLLGHGAGAVLLPELLPRLLERRIPVASLILLAPAIRVDDFERRLLLPLAAGSIKQLAVFGLSPDRELNDTCAAGRNPFYQKSLLYLISRGLEAPARGRAYSGEIPLVGMAKDFQARHLLAKMKRKVPNAAFVTAPTETPEDERTDAIRHGELQDDSFTMTSVAMRFLNSSEVDPFRGHSQLRGLDHVPGKDTKTGAAGGIADTQPPDQPPVATTAGARSSIPRVPACRNGEPPPEIGEAPPDGDSTSAALIMEGFRSLEKRITRPERATPRTGRLTHV